MGQPGSNPLGREEILLYFLPSYLFDGSIGLLTLIMVDSIWE